MKAANLECIGSKMNPAVDQNKPMNRRKFIGAVAGIATLNKASTTANSMDHDEKMKQERSEDEEDPGVYADEYHVEFIDWSWEINERNFIEIEAKIKDADHIVQDRIEGIVVLWTENEYLDMIKINPSVEENKLFAAAKVPDEIACEVEQINMDAKYIADE